MIKLNYTLKDPRCAPHVGSAHSAGLDLRVFLGANPRVDGIEIQPGEVAEFGTGVAVAIPEGWVGLIAPRSSTGKLGLMLTNTTGVIDSDYRGEIGIKVRNLGTEPQILYNFDRIVQLVVVPHLPTQLCEQVDSLDKTERGESGWGSSGQN